MLPSCRYTRAAAAAAGLCLAIVAPSRAQAGQDGIRAVDNSVSAAYDYLHVFYAEPSDGGIAASNYDTEDGALSDGAMVAASAMRSFGSWQDLYAQASFSRATGRLPYDGHIQFPFFSITAPFQGTSSARINDWGLRLGKGVEAGERWLWTPYLAYGYHAWARTLPGNALATGYAENYSHHALQFGTRVQYAPAASVVLTADGRFGTTLAPHISVPSQQFSQRLGAAPIIDLEAEADYAFHGHFHVFMGWRYSRYGYGQSGVEAGQLEPASTTELMSCLAGLRFSFR
jgi:hypothetical protein